MTETPDFYVDRASVAEIAGHLAICDAHFIPPLRQRVDIATYAEKIASSAKRFEAWSDGCLVGLVAMYCNDFVQRCAYITSVSLLPAWFGRGVASCLLKQSIVCARESGVLRVSLAVAASNEAAITLYTRQGFVPDQGGGEVLTMNLNLQTGERV